MATSVNLSAICGVPGFCIATMVQTCHNITTIKCQDCSLAGGIAFIVIVLMLALTSVVGNFLTFYVIKRRREKGAGQIMDIYIVSLAVADTLSGLEIIAITLPNFCQTLNLTSAEIFIRQSALQGSPSAVAGGIFGMMGLSSLYHLLLLGILRLYALKWPLQFRLHKKKSAIINLSVLWAVAIFTSSMTALAPDGGFLYYPSLFIYFPNIANLPGQFTPGIVLLALLLFTYIAMTATSVYCFILIRIRSHRSYENMNASEQRLMNLRRQEVSVFKTVAIMQIGFTATIVPLGVVMGLFFAKYIRCDSVSTLTMITFYIKKLNCFMNFLIYNVRDHKFRATLKEIFAPLKRAPARHNIKKDEVLSKNNQYTITELRSIDRSTDREQS